MGKKTTVWISMILLALSFGNPGASPAHDPSSVAPPAEKALVQILIYGLSGFEFTKDVFGNEIVFVHMARQTQHPVHKTEIRIGGVKNGDRVWTPLATSPAGHTLQFPDLTGRFQARGWGSASGLPASSEEASEARWILRHEELAPGITAIDRTAANVHLELRSGMLETCALVHGPKKSNDHLLTCQLEYTPDNGKIKLRRAFSEYMVLRQAVDLDEFRILMVDANGIPSTPIVVPSTDGAGASIEWDDGSGAKTYTKFFDVLIANIPTSNKQRIMQPGHGDLLRGEDHLFPDAPEFWKTRAPECREERGNWVCPNCYPDRQPKCWAEYFVDYNDYPSGANHPVCPLVGYP